MPLTMGYYTRADIPFYYALADAFTICDQYFCSSLTGTTPNRFYLWTGTIRERERPIPGATFATKTRLRSPGELADLSGAARGCRRFVEGLSERTDRRIAASSEEEDAWLANFGDNPLEYFTQFHVHLCHRVTGSYREREASRCFPREIAALTKNWRISRCAADRKYAIGSRSLIATLAISRRIIEAEFARGAARSLEKLPNTNGACTHKAFCTNVRRPGLPANLRISPIATVEAAASMLSAQGRLLHQFRKDVGRRQATDGFLDRCPGALSDHPSSAWYGAWYIAEVLEHSDGRIRKSGRRRSSC